MELNEAQQKVMNEKLEPQDQQWYLVDSGGDGAVALLARWPQLRSTIHDVFCVCGKPDTCDNCYLADWDDYCEEERREGAHWDLEDGWVSVRKIHAIPKILAAQPPSAPAQEQDSEILARDLAMLIRRLCRRISKKNCHEDDDVVKAALGFLERKGLQGNFLRSEFTEESAQPEPPSSAGDVVSEMCRVHSNDLNDELSYRESMTAALAVARRGYYSAEEVGNAMIQSYSLNLSSRQYIDAVRNRLTAQQDKEDANAKRS